jgi:hypothetical protein
MLRSSILSFLIAFSIACGDDGAPSDAGGASDSGGADAASVVDAGPLDAGDGLEDCDPGHATCREAPPTCPIGEAASVFDGCWGPCVGAELCRPIDCARTEDCPVDWECNPDDRCGPPIEM